MNHAIFVVKVIKNPVHLIYKEYPTIEITVQFPVVRQKNSRSELTILLWGGHRDDFLKYYKVQDYLLIEGILTLKGYKNEKTDAKVIVKRLYPFLLN
uniref:hypothetical protein n=1 Tax=Sporochnus bolleanus TaxID=461143 RepID=UPI002E75C710|nr:hypothetical protein V2496_pgp011 [Sporochnus bolleanus]WAM64937.1 hypothetical protein [Sporochnus bolleanus]